MRIGQRGRLAWILGLGLADLIAVVWFVATSQPSEGDVLASPRTEQTEAAPPPVLPTPTATLPLVTEAGGVTDTRLQLGDGL